MRVRLGERALDGALEAVGRLQHVPQGLHIAVHLREGRTPHGGPTSRADFRQLRRRRGRRASVSMGGRPAAILRRVCSSRSTSSALRPVTLSPSTRSSVLRSATVMFATVGSSARAFCMLASRCAATVAASSSSSSSSSPWIAEKSMLNEARAGLARSSTAGGGRRTACRDARPANSEAASGSRSSSAKRGRPWLIGLGRRCRRWVIGARRRGSDCAARVPRLIST